MLTGLCLVKPGVAALPYRWAPGLFPSQAPPMAEPVTALVGLRVKWWARAPGGLVGHR
ncbi:hypothetical protein ACFFSW_17245 [Saccharothrix longispora]|uniref:Uncharacterized protein n=1 Tax=Saccharothrix longispora TaxID=33920 RepID=A0ABU1PUN6_9PSEU|nr:hypothetical protein [Saccharothrix longispora]MDR6593609.1 hypothetical protein [Saccharothrix longispora]